MHLHSCGRHAERRSCRLYGGVKPARGRSRGYSLKGAEWRPPGIVCWVVTAVLLLGAWFGPARADALARLTSEHLEAIRQALTALRAQWRAVPRSGPYQEVRANIHVHSSLSHDSRGTVEEVVAAAKAVGTRVVLFTEHPCDRLDWFTDGHRGVRDGVLLVPGAEMRGFLVFPRHSLRGLDGGSPQELADLVSGRGGLVFLSHLEERMGWEIRGLTGVEVYNTHADFKDEKGLLAALRDPLWVLRSAALWHAYPQEAFAAVQDYPADYLAKWDRLCAWTPHTGVAANDSHQSIGIVVRAGDGERLRLEDALGRKLLELDVPLLPPLQPLRKGAKPGDVIFRALLDPYEVSLRHVGTHLLVSQLSEGGVRDALKAGRAFVAFDWLADATGFDFAAVGCGRRWPMGSRVPLMPGLRLAAVAPLPVRWRLLRDGKELATSRGREFQAPVAGPGVYRVEAWLDIAGEKMIWIISNPVYVRATADK